MHLFEGLLLGISGILPHLACLDESLLMAEAFVLLDLLGHGSVEEDVCADGPGGFALLLLLVLFNFGRLLLLISLFASLSYMKIMKSLKSVQTQF
jgi:hypothetical protein